MPTKVIYPEKSSHHFPPDPEPDHKKGYVPLHPMPLPKEPPPSSPPQPPNEPPPKDQKND